MKKETYRGKRVIISCPAELYAFYSLIGSIDDMMSDQHFVRTDQKLSHAWLSLLTVLDDSICGFCQDEGTCSSSDIVCLFCADDTLPDPFAQ